MSITKIKLSNLIFYIICFMILTSNAFATKVHTSQNKLIYYTDVGYGKPLVLIHAFPTDLRLWNPQQENLKKYFRVISLDL